MKRCPKCRSERIAKNGFRSGRQRYNCKDCGFNPSVEERGYPQVLKKKVIQLYLEGMGIRAISRIFKIAHTTVMNWVKVLSKELGEIEPSESVEIMEIDEMHHWVDQKKTKLW